MCFALVACGGNGGDGSNDGGGDEAASGVEAICDPPLDECSGDPVGTWAIVDACEPIDRDCLESTPVEAAVETLAGTLTLAPAGTLFSDVEAQIDCRFEGPKSCVEPQYQQFGCPGGVEPCTWSTDAWISLANASQWMPADTGVQIVNDEQPEHAMTFCADGDAAEIRVEPLLDERDGMRLRFERMPG